ncbi:MAG: metallophosphoesterase family protein [Chloroflexota bacterium]
MRIAVISDVHGNLSALESVLESILNLDPEVEQIVSAGNLVGRGPHPNEVIDRIRSSDVASVRGNYEDAIARGLADSGRDFATPLAHREDARAIQWTRGALTAENLEWVEALPRDIRLARLGMRIQITANSGDERVNQYKRGFFMRSLFGGLIRQPKKLPTRQIRVFHGSPRAMNEFIREDTAGSILATIAQDAQADVLISGHAGSNFVRQAAGMTFVGAPGVSGVFNTPGLARYGLVTILEEVEAQCVDVEYDPSHHVTALRMSGLAAIV